MLSLIPWHFSHNYIIATIMQMHHWDISISEAFRIQEMIKDGVITKDKIGEIVHLGLIAGVDVSYEKGSNKAICVIAVVSFPDMDLISYTYADGTISFRYIPGLLTFREGPLFLKAFDKLSSTPDIFLFDGQGIAHPKGVGIATHMGVYLGIATIGCAKTCLIGDYKEPGLSRGDSTPLVYKGKNIGSVLRTRTNIRPIFVSPGHMVSIDTAAKITLMCAKGFRIPEPIRHAHLIGKNLLATHTPRPADII